ncbi:thioredoxin domain-containing protein [Aurantimonas sp. HBX-1]|uniref:thioredoxin domain-containing protein n=1 Tax=Aurantimonas sp. HBX-1 TaxID=2906072 RepID=UPI001F45AD58|nr:thioredoxin domain-containing protein [Aurantimonas sp. HBX-1]UIJ71134.1 thioredoxin domain-containing protein [Aurantimonas sp. HBX-1]
MTKQNPAARARPVTLSRAAMLLSGACLLAIAGCTEEVDSAAADVVAAPQGVVKMAQADTSPAQAPATPEATAGATAQAVTPAAEAPAASGSADVEALMEEGPLKDVVIGDANAPVTIIEYASMTCSHCADFHENSYPAIKQQYIDTGKAKLILREFPFDPRALAAFMLARCTGDDARRTAMVDVLFDQQAEWARAENASTALLNIAKLAGMSQEEFTTCLNDKELQQKIVETQQRGQAEFGVEATPTFFVNGDKYSGSLSPEQMAAVIEAHL